MTHRRGRWDRPNASNRLPNSGSSRLRARSVGRVTIEPTRSSVIMLDTGGQVHIRPRRATTAPTTKPPAMRSTRASKVGSASLGTGSLSVRSQLISDGLSM
jgi:hypothetical protein